MIHVNLLYLNFLVSAVLPVLTALVTHQLATDRYKTAVLMGLSVVGGIANMLIQRHGSFNFSQAGIWSVLTFVIAYVMHSGLLKPFGITGSQGVIQARYPQGLGRPGAHAGPPPTSMA